MKRMKILIACEFSGRVRDALIKRGHDALSCDLLPTERPGSHYRGDIFDVLYDGWDMLIAFPPCTYLCNSGVRWLYNSDGSKNLNRWIVMRKGAEFFRSLLTADIPKICIENPIMHGYAKEIIGQNQTQIIQPWQFGHGETKATCLWLKNLPDLKPTNIVSGRLAKCHKLPPTEDRAKLRSITYQGIADAMAAQWG